MFFTAYCSTVLAQVPVDDTGVHRCANPEIEAQLQRRFGGRAGEMARLNQLVSTAQAERAANPSARLAPDVIYRIPVVVHVIHNTANGTIGGAGNSNISDAQILSQIRVLNEDYRKVAGTPGGASTNPLAVDTGIEFFLATQDPDGKPTTGITRHYYPTKSSFDLFNDLFQLSSIVYWPSNQYLNIWVCNISNRGYLGYGQFPSAADTLKGLGETDEKIDGFVVDHRYFGSQTGTVVSQLYCCGRTATHEIGHWLGLFHPNGDVRCGDDYVADTPVIEALNQTDRCDPLYSTCAGTTRTRNLIEDYMDYSPDQCMNVFTGGQRDRMRTVLQLSPRRRQLIQSTTALASTEKLTITTYPNPVLTSATVDVQFTGNQSFNVELYDASGRLRQTQNYISSASRRITVDASALSAGVYVLRVTTAGERASQRLLVK
ncbi:T9SS type A sorting domain-containing protein [Fibrella sp. HMF5335]|uniref:T9SS type A sorting domain-containing protein n=1 Tax=Fibrella rubiginis TaxID=2817060 RepID=A0A939GD42_9BACT|nr:T9SS type A sorting domain-containing protein [Fibrella rubiginis]MBO0936754.1 T9SS type A sorting domain-containing protein [Fibrella rubiginis]